MRVLAFDPGGTTGWAYWGGENFDLGGGGFNSGQIGPDDHHVELYDFLELQATDNMVLVYEAFEYRHEQRTNVNLISREYIGVIRLFGRQRGLPVIKQETGTVIPGPKGKAFWTDDKVKRVGLWSPGNPHANDAMRHLLYFLMFKSQIPQERMKPLWSRLK